MSWLSRKPSGRYVSLLLWVVSIAGATLTLIAMIASIDRLGDSTRAATELAEFRTRAIRTVLVAQDAQTSGDSAQLDDWIAATDQRLAAALDGLLDSGDSVDSLRAGLESAWAEQAEAAREYLDGNATFSEVLQTSDTLDAGLGGLLDAVADWSESETDQLRRLLELGALAAFAAAIMVTVATLRMRRQRLSSDPLTGLPTLGTLRSRIAAALRRRGESGALESPLSILVIDLDRFKRINDTLGPQAGDRLLEDVATRIGAALNGPYTLARRGSEFLLLQESCDREAAQDVALAVSTAVGQFAYDWGEVQMNASIGISLAPEDAEDADTLIQHADSARDAAKKDGGDTYRFYVGPRQHLDDGKLALEAELRRASERDEFVLHYQPYMAVATGALTGAEALLRWQSPARGLVRPDDFIPLLEETGLVVEVGEWVLRSACRQALLWREDLAPEFIISVNVSARQLVVGNFAELVAQVIEETGLPAHALDIEITETAAISDPDTVARILQELDALGVSSALDDFGTGSSSLTHLRDLRTRSVKIDRSFVAGMEESDDDRGIVAGVIATAHALGRTVTAEGVETRTQLLALEEMGCDTAQGFLIARPCDAGQLAELLQSWETMPRLLTG